jgi:molybdopterin-guanine dinucleotide biosynthesis protein A
MQVFTMLTGVILAGGEGRRMGGQDKGLVLLHERPLISWVIDALTPQVDEILIIANRHLDNYRHYGHRVVCDLRPGFEGPLAGFESALTHTRTEWALFCPTDVPFLPPDYALTMTGHHPRRPAVATVGEYWQPVFSLLPRHALPSLSSALDAGERKLQRWLASQAPLLIPMDAAAWQLRDADTLEALQTLARTSPGH